MNINKTEKNGTCDIFRAHQRVQDGLLILWSLITSTKTLPSHQNNVCSFAI